MVDRAYLEVIRYIARHLEGTPINWSAQPVTTDLFGRTIPGVTTNIHYSVGNVT